MLKNRLIRIYFANLGQLARIRLLGRFTTCLAQTTTAWRLLFALVWHFMPQECDFFLKFSSLNFFKILYHYNDVKFDDESAYLRFMLVTIFLS